MGINKHLMEYTLNKVYMGNRSEYARALRVDPSNVRREMNKSDEDDCNARFIRDTLSLFDDIPEALYGVLFTYVIGTGNPCKYHAVLKEVREMCQTLSPRAIREKHLEDVREGVLTLATRIELAYCGMNLDHSVGCKAYEEAIPEDDEADKMTREEMEPCPCAPLIDLMNRLAEKAVYPCDPEPKPETDSK